MLGCGGSPQPPGLRWVVCCFEPLRKGWLSARVNENHLHRGLVNVLCFRGHGDSPSFPFPRLFQTVGTVSCARWRTSLGGSGILLPPSSRRPHRNFRPHSDELDILGHVVFHFSHTLAVHGHSILHLTYPCLSCPDLLLIKTLQVLAPNLVRAATPLSREVCLAVAGPNLPPLDSRRTLEKVLDVEMGRGSSMF